MSSEQVSIGIVGCGVIGRAHAQAAADDAGIRLAAIADVQLEAAKAVAEQHSDESPAVYDSAEALIADPKVEAVVLALPTGIRGELARKVLRAGKHLLLEKPAALDSEELDSIAELAGDRVVACCSSRMRYTPSSKVVKQVLARGELGALRVLHVRCLKADTGPGEKAPPAWRVSHRLNGGGFLVNWGVYDLDYLLGVTGWSLEPRWILASAWPIAENRPGRVAEDSDAECHVLATIVCEGGVVIHVERGEFTSSKTEEAWSIVGSEATLRLDMVPRSNKAVWIDRSRADGPVESEQLWSGDEAWPMCHSGPVQNFAAAIRGDAELETDLSRARLLQAIFDGIYASAATGQPVALEGGEAD